MKTAEDWAKEVGSLRGQDGISSIIVSKIQLDAWKQGMSDAEQICMALKNKAYGVLANKIECSNAIITARDKKDSI